MLVVTVPFTSFRAVIGNRHPRCFIALGLSQSSRLVFVVRFLILFFFLIVLQVSLYIIDVVPRTAVTVFTISTLFFSSSIVLDFTFSVFRLFAFSGHRLLQNICLPIWVYIAKATGYVSKLIVDADVGRSKGTRGCRAVNAREWKWMASAYVGQNMPYECVM